MSVIAVLSPASVSGSPALSKCLSSSSSLGSMDPGGVEVVTGLLALLFCFNSNLNPITFIVWWSQAI